MPFAFTCCAGPTVCVRDVENQLRLKLLTGDHISNRTTHDVWLTAVLIIRRGLALCAQTVTLEFTMVQMAKSSTVG